VNPTLLFGGIVVVILLINALGGKAQAASAPKATLIKSPFPGVSDKAWTAFVSAMASQPFGYESPKNFYGAFVFGVRRLCDLKVMKGPPKKVNGLWTAPWVTPKAKFLGTPTLQYAALAKSMQLYAKVIAAKYQRALGTTLEGKKVTLSGLLGAAHVAGGAGLGKWLADPTRRAKFSHVTAAYLKTTGLF